MWTCGDGNDPDRGTARSAQRAAVSPLYRRCIAGVPALCCRCIVPVSPQDRRGIGPVAARSPAVNPLAEGH
jgi:hypothetical protein